MSHSYQASEFKKIKNKKCKGRAALGLPSSFFPARRQSCYSDTFSQRRRVYQRGTAGSSCYPTRSRNIPSPPPPQNKKKQHQNQTSLQLTDQTTRLPRSTQTLNREQQAAGPPARPLGALRSGRRLLEAAGSGAGSLATATAAEGRARKEEEGERKGFRSREPQPRHAQPCVCLPTPCPERGARKRGASKGTAPPGVRRRRRWWRQARPELFK